MKPALGIIITGQIRTFFMEKVFTSFYEWMCNLKLQYRLYIVCVISDDIIPYSKFTFFKELAEKYMIMKFDSTKIPAIPDHFLNVIYEELKKNGTLEMILKDCVDPRKRIHNFLTQKTQIETGVHAMKSFGVEIPTYMKTRFDLFYGVQLIPYSNPNPIFPHSKEIESFQLQLLAREGFSSVEQYIEYIQGITLDTMRIPENLWQVNFGGVYYYNKDIFDNNDKLWLSSDFIFIGKAELFERYCECDLLQNPEKLVQIARERGHTYILTNEPLLCLYLYSIDITPIMLLNSYIIYIQRDD